MPLQRSVVRLRWPPVHLRPALDVRPVPDHRSSKAEDRLRKVLVASTQLVDVLVALESEPLCDLLSSDEFVNLDAACHVRTVWRAGAAGANPLCSYKHIR